MTSSRSLRKCRDEQFADGNTEVRAWYRTTIFPKFVWVCELSTVNMYPKEVIGEIILDAASSADAYTDSLIIAHYPGRIFCRLPRDMMKSENDTQGIVEGEFSNDLQSVVEDEVGVYTDEIHKIYEWKTFLPYDSNLYDSNLHFTRDDE